MADDVDCDDGSFDVVSQQQRAMNEEQLFGGDIVVENAPVLPFLSAPKRGELCFKPFRLPGGVERRDASVKFTLGCKRRPGGAGAVPAFKRVGGPSPDFVIPTDDFAAEAEGLPTAASAPASALPEGYEPLVLWVAEEGDEADKAARHRVVVDDCIGTALRPHQREGVSFMFDCIHSLRGFDGAGCILADDMGLGKTLQSVALLWTALRQGIVGTSTQSATGATAPSATPSARRAIVVCPTSLVANWAAEVKKWLGERLRPLALAEVTHDEAVRDIGSFLSGRSWPLLIISYETFRLHAPRFHARGADACDLLICDEAHRLKNGATLTNKALAALPCRRRILLSGTPMQNDLDEFFAMVDFTNPGILGDNAAFRRTFEQPILKGREPTATDADKAAGAAAGANLSAIVNRFILRRTNTLLSAHLPPKRAAVVCVRLAPLQVELYSHFLQSKSVAAVLAGRQTGVLSSITALRKLINHPKLVADVIRARQAAGSGARGGGEAAGFDDCAHLFPANVFADRNASFPELGGKFALAARMLKALRSDPARDRIVIVSIFTQTLDLFSALCREKNWPFIRLDGSTAPGKRQKLVNAFNDASRDEFVFLLSSKAGGCGLNLIGANRLILFDPDWNPATDLQAAARVWRDGQRKRTYVYRFLAAGTMEEKVFQRQLSKKGLQTVVVEEGDEVNSLSTDDLRDLFLPPDVETLSDTHDTLRCSRCRKGEVPEGESDGEMEAQKKDASAVRGEAQQIAAAAAAEAAPLVGGGGGASESTEVSKKRAKAAPAAAPAEAAIEVVELDDDEDADIPVVDAEAEHTEGAKKRSRARRAPSASAAAKTQAAAFASRFAAQVRSVLSAPLAPIPEGTHRRQMGKPGEDDLKSWSHHVGVAGVAEHDAILAAAGADCVSFTFGLEVPGRDLVELNAVLDAKERARKLAADQEAAAARMLNNGSAGMFGGAKNPVKAAFSGQKFAFGGNILSSLNLGGSSAPAAAASRPWMAAPPKREPQPGRSARSKSALGGRSDPAPSAPNVSKKAAAVGSDDEEESASEDEEDEEEEESQSETDEDEDEENDEENDEDSGDRGDVARSSSAKAPVLKEAAAKTGLRSLKPPQQPAPPYMEANVSSSLFTAFVDGED